MEPSFEPASCSFAVGWLRLDSDNENSTVTFNGDGTCCVHGMTLSITGISKGTFRLLLTFRVNGQRRLWERSFIGQDPLEILLWVHSCMVYAGRNQHTSRFMEFYREEKDAHERKERGMVTSMSMLDFLQRMADSTKLTKDRFGEIMHGDYSEDEKQRALEQMEMAGGYDNLADD